MLAVTLFFWREHIPWLAGADACAPAIALGQAIGRLGCQAAGDGDWGPETTLPWGMAYPYAVVGWDKPPGVRVHPTPLYEAAVYAAIFALLWRLRREPAADGAILALYLVLSGAARFLVEFVRVNPRIAFGLTEAQLASLTLVAIGGGGLVSRRGGGGGPRPGVLPAPGRPGAARRGGPPPPPPPAAPRPRRPPSPPS